MVCLSEGNTVNAQLENMILEVRNYDDEMSGHQKVISHKSTRVSVSKKLFNVQSFTKCYAMVKQFRLVNF